MRLIQLFSKKSCLLFINLRNKTQNLVPRTELMTQIRLPDPKQGLRSTPGTGYQNPDPEVTLDTQEKES